MTNENKIVIHTIKEMRESTQSGLTYELSAQVADIYRMKEGLTLITITDGSEEFKLSAFVPGGVAFPEVAKGTIATFLFRRKHHEGTLQGALQDVKEASNDEQQMIRDRINSSAQEKYTPVQSGLDTHFLVKPLQDRMVLAATLIRKAIYEKRPIIISHHADCDGFSAALQVEVAIKSIINQVHRDLRYLPTYYSRNPSRTPFYDVTDVTKDIGFFQISQEKNNVSSPLFIIIDNGSTPQDLLAIRKAKLYGAQFVVVDHHDPGTLDENGLSAVCKEVLAHVNPHLGGLSKNISASMLCYDLAHLINETSPQRADVAALGGIADKCAGEEISWLVEKSGHSKSFIEELALLVDFEIFNTKFNQAKSPLIDLITGSLDIQKSLIALYKPIMATAQAEVKLVTDHYATRASWGKFSVFLLDGQLTSLRGDYFSLGKLAGILHGSNATIKPRITVIHGDSMLVFRVDQKEFDGFDVNKIVKELKSALPHARISGGGHAVAGSIRFVAAAKEEVLETIASLVKNL